MTTDFTGSHFTTIYGRNLLGEFQNFVHQPALVVTMEDLWPKIRHHFSAGFFKPHFVTTLEHEALQQELKRIPEVECVVGVGGGQALDVAKFVAWRRRLPCFQAPTAITVNAAFGHRTAVRFESQVRYIGWVVPEAVYVDIDVVQSAPKALNRSGVCDVFCYHTAFADWRLARDRGRCEEKWPYDERLAREAYGVFENVLEAVEEIHQVSETGIRTLMNAHRWGGAAFHNAGWNPRHIEGFDHFLFYALEYLTKKHFLHGQPVCLGVYVGSVLHDFKAAEMLQAIRRVGVDIRPEAMGIRWDDVEEALRILPKFVEQAGLWYGIAQEMKPDAKLVRHLRDQINAAYGPWEGKPIG